MRRSVLGVLALGLAMATAAVAHDEWDANGTFPGADDGATTHDKLVHGSRQRHDLQTLVQIPLAGDPTAEGIDVPDQDWYTFDQEPRASYEIVVEPLGPTIVPPDATVPVGLLSLVDSAGTVVTPSSDTAAGALRTIRSLRLENAGASLVSDRFVRVLSQGCTITCTANADYEIRAYETTYFLPRFNNSATQLTILLLQNPTAAAVNGNVWFRDAAGTLLGSQPVAIPAGGVLVVNTATVPGVAGASGTATFSNDAPYGALAGKAVALEPATGFTFDTPMAPRAN